MLKLNWPSEKKFEYKFRENLDIEIIYIEDRDKKNIEGKTGESR